MKNLIQRISFFYCLCFFLLMLVFANTQNQINKYPTFDEYTKTFHKIYDKEQYHIRQQIYKYKVLEITKKGQSWLGINNFTDWTNQELNRFKNSDIFSTRSNIASTSHRALIKSIPRLLDQTLPSSYDWSSLVQLSSVKSLGYCGAAYAFATTAFFQADSIINKNQNKSLDLSQQFLISCDSQSKGCESGYLQTPMDLVIKKQGIPLQSKYKYTPYSPQPKQICRNTDIFAVSSNYRMSYYDMFDQEKIKTIIYKKPAVIGICAQDFINYAPGTDQDSKILKCSPFNVKINHAILLVGYTSKYWIIKNQWGTTWGLNGYAFISRKPTQNCCLGKQIHTTGAKTTLCSVQDCDICVEEDTCFKCKSGMYVDHQPFTGIQTCKTCLPKQCFQCFNYYGYCSECVQGYAINQVNGECQLSTIQNCNHIINGYCSQCHRGYVLSSDMLSCNADCNTKYCKKCAQGYCTICLDGYTLKTINNTLKCQINSCNITNCQLCDSNGACVKCNMYLTLQASACVNKCTKKDCLSCKPNDWYCAECIGNKSFNYWIQACQEFNVTNCGIHLFGKCYQCKSGYQFDEWRTTCTQVCDVLNCTVCQRTDTTICTTCQSGYKLNIVNDQTVCSPYICSIVNCTACNQNGTACMSCITKYHVYNSTTNVCEIRCSLANCLICRPTDTSCQRCNTGYVLEYDSQACYASNISHCTLVGFDNNRLQCWACEDKYQVDIVGWQQCFINCTDQFCRICDFDTLLVCSQCVDGYHLYLINQLLQCSKIPSLMPNCYLVSFNQTYCYQCEDYFSYDVKSTSCLPYTTNCKDMCVQCPAPGSTAEGCLCQEGYAYDVLDLTCGINPFGDSCIQIGLYGSKLICFKCEQGYVLASNFLSCLSSCVAPNCTTCYQGFNAFCQTCVQGFYADPNWKCLNCPVSNCKSCSSRVCLQCLVGYQLTPNGLQCLQFVCKGGSAFNGFSCSCLEGYYFSGDTCVKCAKSDCKWCDVDGCIQCKEGFLMSQGICQPCSSNCRKCQNYQSCQQCTTNFFLEQTSQKCIAIGFNRTYYISGTNSVVQCPFGCIQCQSNGLCTSCYDGYALSVQKQCIPCQKQCKTCYPTFSFVCLSCISGFFLQNFECLRCNNAFCLQCQTAQNVCTKCFDGYFLENKGCYPCPNNCLLCTIKGQCTTCFTGFALTDLKTCELCAGDCRSCISTSLAECTTYCQQNQYLQGQTCLSCPENCQKCQSSSNCTKCKSEYLLKQNVCTLPCEEGCYFCASQDSTICNTCFAGYQLVNDKCIPDTTCNATNNCVVCPLGYVLDSSLCKKCQGNQNCTQCSAFNQTQCIECMQGFFVINKMCGQCPQQCKLCKRQNLCTSCQDSYYLVQFEDYLGKCASCNQMCKTCEIHPLKCTSCKEGFSLTINKKCLRDTKIQIVVKLNIDLDLYYTIATQVRQDLVSMLGDSYKQATYYLLLKKLRSGSTIVEAEIGIPADQDIQTTLSNIKAQLYSTSQLGGVDLIAVQKIQLNTDVDNNRNQLFVDDNNKNKTIITIVLAVVIPSIVIILVVVGYLLRRKINKQNTVTNVNVNENNQNEASFQKFEPKTQIKKSLPPLNNIAQRRLQDHGSSFSTNIQKSYPALHNQAIHRQGNNQSINSLIEHDLISNVRPQQSQQLPGSEISRQLTLQYERFNQVNQSNQSSRRANRIDQKDDQIIQHRHQLEDSSRKFQQDQNFSIEKEKASKPKSKNNIQQDHTLTNSNQMLNEKTEAIIQQSNVLEVQED